MTRMVNCIKLGKEAPGLKFPPLPNDLGKRIFENVSQDAWDAWTRHKTTSSATARPTRCKATFRPPNNPARQRLPEKGYLKIPAVVFR